MSRARTCIVFLACTVAAFVGCGSCEERAKNPTVKAQVKQEPQREVLDIPLEPDSPEHPSRLMELAGEVDVENRYLPAVMVAALSGEREMMWCSGAAVSHHVVLTAGHCVCLRKSVEGGGSQSIIDPSTCLKDAKVEVVLYKPPVEEGTRSSGSLGKVYHGKVQPHPSLSVRLDPRGHVAASHADLALIVLSQPLEFPGFALPDEEVQMGDSVIIVGHEYDEEDNVFGGERRYSTNKVTRLMTAGDERVLIQQPGEHRYRQDSGGPCLRQGMNGPTLVGISNRWLGEGAAFTSIYEYRAWVRDAIQHAEPSSPGPR